MARLFPKGCTNQPRAINRRCGANNGTPTAAPKSPRAIPIRTLTSPLEPRFSVELPKCGANLKVFAGPDLAAALDRKHRNGRQQIGREIDLAAAVHENLALNVPVL